ncbi:MAG: DNA-directed RNA polymerase subunit B, partial [archaeon]
MTNSWENYSLVESWFKSKNFAQMNITSYNQFVDDRLQEIIKENKIITPKIEEVRIELEEIEVLKPRIVEADGSPRNDFYPMEARIRNRTYSAPLFLTMRLLRRDVEQDVKKTYIGELPVMLKSKLCHLTGKTSEELISMGEDPLDFGGYFIINGSEKALTAQEVLSSDRILITESGDKFSAEVISTKGAFKGRVRVTRSKDGMLSVSFPASPRKLRLFALLRALGLKDDKEMIGAFPQNDAILNDVLINIEANDVKDEEEALDRIG